MYPRVPDNALIEAFTRRLRDHAYLPRTGEFPHCVTEHYPLRRRLLARHERAALAKVLLAESCERQHIAPDQLVIHADRGPAMISQPAALLLATLGVVPSRARPQVSNDHPCSEAQFKTLKYRADFPDRFGASSPGTTPSIATGRSG